MTTRTNRLALTTGAVATTTVLYTCPANIRTIVKEIDFVRVGTQFIAIQVANAGTGKAVLVNQNAADGVVIRWQAGFVVLVAGDRLELVTTGTGNWWCGAFGSELPAP